MLIITGRRPSKVEWLFAVLVAILFLSPIWLTMHWPGISGSKRQSRSR